MSGDTPDNHSGDAVNVSGGGTIGMVKYGSGEVGLARQLAALRDLVAALRLPAEEAREIEYHLGEVARTDPQEDVLARRARRRTTLEEVATIAGRAGVAALPVLNAVSQVIRIVGA